MIEKTSKIILPLLFALGAGEAWATLSADVARMVREAGFRAGEAALWVADVDTGYVEAAVNAGRPMEPASIMKVVTTAVALDRLGPAWRSTTRFSADSRPDKNGRITGAVLTGGGDAHFVMEEVLLLAQRLKGAGVKTIAGDVTIDRSRYAAVASVSDQSAFDGAGSRPYNVGPDAAALNFKTVSLTVTPDGRVAALPLLSGIGLPARVRVVKGNCGDWKQQLSPVFDGRTLRFKGTYPAACGTKTLHYSAWDADRYATALLRQVFTESGIRWQGRVVSGRTPEGKIPLAESESAPLSRTVVWINKFSNNTMARQLFLELGLTDSRGTTAPATLERSRAVVKAWLQEKAIPAKLTIDNGSGLSRSARVSAETLGGVLRTAWKSAYMPEFMASLPAAGIDGTMKRRPVPVGSAHLKTGYLKTVRSLAGFVTDKKGRRHILVLMVNAANPAAAKALGDDITARIAALDE